MVRQRAFRRGVVIGQEFFPFIVTEQVCARDASGSVLEKRVYETKEVFRNPPSLNLIKGVGVQIEFQDEFPGSVKVVNLQAE